jgi:hypothetical protein
MAAGTALCVLVMGGASGAWAGNANFNGRPDQNLGRIMQGSTPSTTVTPIRDGNGTVTAGFQYTPGMTGPASMTQTGNGALPSITVSLQNSAAGTASPSVGLKTWTVSITSGQTVGADNSVNVSATLLANRVVTATSVDLGTAIVGGTWGGTSDLSTTGANSVATAVSIATTGGPVGGISVTGGTGASFQSAADTATRLLSGSFSTAGNHSGTITLATTGEGLAGEMPIDVGVGYSAVALDHANASFSGDTDQDDLTIDFGTVSQNSVQSQTFSLYNLVALAGFTASLDLDGVSEAGDTFNKFSTTLPGSASPQLLSAGSSLSYSVNFDTTTVGLFSATYTLSSSDEDLDGAAASAPLTIHVSGNVTAVPAPATLGLLTLLSAATLRRRRR